MDAIDRAMAEGCHLINDHKLSSQTWEEFEYTAKGKTVILFGAGKGANYYYYRYKEDALIDMVIDNDNRIQGYVAGDVMGEIAERCKEVKISDISGIEQYNRDDIVVLIASLRHYVEIAEQLREKGISRYFVVLLMEANQRKKDGVGEQEDRTTFEYYLRESCKQKVDNKKIVFYTMGSYSGHGKYIAEQLRRIRNDLDIVWHVNDLTVEVPKGIRRISHWNMKKYLYEIETSGIWVYDCLIPTDIRKRPEQIYIQTKHWPSITLKKFCLDETAERKELPRSETDFYNGKIMDYVITGSEIDEESCRRGYGLESAKFCRFGSPRSDILFRPSGLREKICGLYCLNAEHNILLYAPTFRYEKGGSYQPEIRGIELDFERTKQALENRFGGNWYIMLRLHPLVADKSTNIRKPEYVIDVSDYSDSQELVAASDITITDYSSIMFEPAFVKKPVFLFATDRKDYIDVERGLLINYDTLPFPIAESNEELAKNIMQFEQEIYGQRVEQFLAQYGVHEDGHASERTAAFISELIESRS